MGNSEEILRGLREWVRRDRDASYILRDYVFMLVRLWRVDRELFRRGLMGLSNALNEEQLDGLTALSLEKPYGFTDMLIKPLPYLNLGKEQGYGVSLGECARHFPEHTIPC